MRELTAYQWFLVVFAFFLIANAAINGQVVTGLIVFAVFFALGWLVRKIYVWLRGPAR